MENLKKFTAEEIKPYAKNAKKHPAKQILQIARSLQEFGWQQPIIVDKKGVIIVGHGRLEAYRKHKDELKLAEPRIETSALSPEQARAYRIADNKLNESEWDNEILIEELKELEARLFELTGFEEDFLTPAESVEEIKNSLKEEFIIPPFSVWDTRQGYWQTRKRRWLELYGDSREGRGDSLLGEGLKKLAQRNGGNLTGTSEFDPVVAEICFRWFNPDKGRILDPFAGGIVRGAVAGVLGCEYNGIDLSKKQVATNRKAIENIFRKGVKPDKEEKDVIKDITDPNKLTPVQKKGNYYLKREDFFVCNGARGAKVRGCYLLVKNGLEKNKDLKGATTAGSRQSPQINILSKVAQHFNIKSEAHTPQGVLSAELEEAKKTGTEIIQHKAGYNSVIIARAKEASKKNGYLNIPFGMECKEAIDNTAKQVANIPDGVKRIVVAVGSGVNLAGIVNGIIATKKDIKILGVKVGKDPVKLLDKYAPSWKKYTTIVDSGVDYHEEINASVEGVQLDPIYEAKCKRFLKDGDLLWIIGVRQSLKEIKKTVINNKDGKVEYNLGNSLDLDKIVDGKFDLIFSCPPYYDLEKYDDGEGDLSMAKTYADFIKDYQKIIAKAVAKLKENRFAVFTVANIRDDEGYYRDLVSDTIRAFELAGARFYNDIILVNAVATASMRARRPFSTNRKVAKVHQNILVFYKGDPKQATESFKDLPQVHRYHENVLVFYKGDINEIKENYKTIREDLFLETED